jgi:hypothetical protein
MEAFSALLNLSVGRMTVYALVVADTVLGGTLAVFVAWPDWFRELAPLKLILLSLSITAPIFVTGAILIATHLMEDAIQKGPSSGEETKQVDRGFARIVPRATSLAAFIHLMALLVFLMTVGIDSLATRHGAIADHSRTFPAVYWASQASFIGNALVIPAATGTTGLRRTVLSVLTVAITTLPWIVLKIS